MKKIFIIEGHEFDNVEDAAQYIIENYEEWYFDEVVDDSIEYGYRGRFEIMSVEFLASDVLKSMDTTAYDDAKYDYADSCRDDIERDLENEECEIFGLDVEYEEEEDDEDDEDDEDEDNDE